jgi:hypothetical protein
VGKWMNADRLGMYAVCVVPQPAPNGGHASRPRHRRQAQRIHGNLTEEPSATHRD